MVPSDSLQPNQIQFNCLQKQGFPQQEKKKLTLFRIVENIYSFSMHFFHFWSASYIIFHFLGDMVVLAYIMSLCLSFYVSTFKCLCLKTTYNSHFRCTPYTTTFSHYIQDVHILYLHKLFWSVHTGYWLGEICKYRL